jgi:hypothetical protein
MAQLQFNAAAVEPTEEFKPVPAGDYNLLIEAVELKPTKAGTGSYLSLKLKVQDGQFAKRVIFDMITYTNPNPQAVEIGHRKLSALCRAAGIMQLSDTQQLVNRVVSAKVGIREDKTGQYEPQNEVKVYKSAAAATQPVTGTDAQTQQTQQSTTQQTQTTQQTAEPDIAADDEDAPWNA